jgi:hypothetical protein
MSYYTNINDCQMDIIFSLNNKIDRTKIHDDDYITSFIINEINTTIYNKLLSFPINKNKEFIDNCKIYYYRYNILHCILLYKKYYKDDNEFNELLMNNENYFKYFQNSDNLYYPMTNDIDKDTIFYAKLALVVIYDDIMTNETDLNKFKDDIKNFIKNYDDIDE